MANSLGDDTTCSGQPGCSTCCPQCFPKCQGRLRPKRKYRFHRLEACYRTNGTGPFAYFFEFRRPDGSGPFLTADEVEDGGRYEIFITSYSGLYRYTIRDIIEVNGFTGTVPNIKFLHKSGDIADICGEKLTVPNLIAAIKKAEQITGLRTVHWCVLPDNDTKRYIFCIEFEPQNDTPEAADTLAAAVERELFGDGIMPYPVFRRQQLLLPVAVQRMKPGWLEAISAGQARNQLKSPVIVSRIPYSEYICEE